MSKPRMIQPRWLARFLAFVCGYFWLPCPLCKQDFAGFEAGESGLMNTPYEGQMVCAGCSEQAHLISMERWAIWREHGVLKRDALKPYGLA